MNHANTSMFEEFVDRRQKFAPIFESKDGVEGIHIVADRMRSESLNAEDPRIATALTNWSSQQTAPLPFGDTRHVAVTGDSQVVNVLIVGRGGTEPLDKIEFERLGGSCYATLEKLGLHECSWIIDPYLCVGIDAAHFVFGAARRSYDTDALRSNDSDRPTIKPLIACAQLEMAKDHYRKLTIQIDATDLVRDMVNAPPNYSTPPIIVDWLARMQIDGLTTRIINIDETTKLTFPGTAAVGRSSIEAPAIFLWEWRGPNGDLDIDAALLGKGITFDAGGLSLKSHDHQFHMKTDLGGAAAVAGAMQCIAESRLPFGVVGMAAFAENLPGPDAVRPGDVMTMANGATVENSFPDAEGRLVLSDLLVYAEREYRPRYMIDVATLTGTVIAALGTETVGCFCPDKELRSFLASASRASGEPIWQLPVGPRYLRSLKSGIASLKNMPAHGRMGILEGSASVAASFLQTFVETSQWAHLDIAGTVWRAEAEDEGPAGATGSGARLLYETVCQMHASAIR